MTPQELATLRSRVPVEEYPAREDLTRERAPVDPLSWAHDELLFSFGDAFQVITDTHPFGERSPLETGYREFHSISASVGARTTYTVTLREELMLSASIAPQLHEKAEELLSGLEREAKKLPSTLPPHSVFREPANRRIAKPLAGARRELDLAKLVYRGLTPLSLHMQEVLHLLTDGRNQTPEGRGDSMRSIFFSPLVALRNAYFSSPTSALARDFMLATEALFEAPYYYETIRPGDSAGGLDNDHRLKLELAAMEAKLMLAETVLSA